ncbi:helix-turn-helix domain-containing protein [Luteimonas terrae]|uniref:helix-turn-helix domain-containing protein n=1 Tax=Luteimonas terrae TaxID=1530191 RepID=UPI003D2F66C2
MPRSSARPTSTLPLGALPRLLSEAEAAAYLEISEITIKRIRARGEIAHVRIGRKTRYTEQHLLEYLTAQSVPSKELTREVGSHRPRPRAGNSPAEAFKLAHRILIEASDGAEQP